MHDRLHDHDHEHDIIISIACMYLFLKGIHVVSRVRIKAGYTCSDKYVLVHVSIHIRLEAFKINIDFQTG